MSLHLGTVVYEFPFLDLSFHYLATVGITVLAGYIHPRGRGLYLAFATIIAVFIAAMSSYLTGYIRTYEYRTWWEIDKYSWIDFSLNDWRAVVIPDLLIYVLGPWYLAWLVGRWLQRRRSRGQLRCESCSYDLTGNVSGSCPECGQGLSATNLKLSSHQP